MLDDVGWRPVGLVVEEEQQRVSWSKGQECFASSHRRSPDTELPCPCCTLHPPPSLVLAPPQDKIEEYADEVFDLLNNGAHMYFCGLKGMMPGIQEMLERVAKEKGINYEEFVEKLKHNNQWHVEVY